MQNNNKAPLKIILFLCNWGAHAAYQTLQDECRGIPEEIHMVRIPCTGRVDRALLMKAFSMGGDGVALIGCEPGTCRYGTGTATARRNTSDMGEILDLMGIGRERLRFATFLPEQGDDLADFLQSFVNDLKQLKGNSISSDTVIKTPLIPPSETKNRIQELITSYDIHACQDCGKCSSACPLALTGKPFSARGIASALIAGDMLNDKVRENAWSCLTCGLCYNRCPSAVNFPEFIKDMRHLYRQNMINGEETHGGFLHSLMRSMASTDIQPNRWTSLPKELQINKDSPVLFYGGCAPYYDIFFGKHMDIETEKILFDAIRLLNFFDVHPRLLNDERCCGHDLLWSGDKEHFLQIAKMNGERLNSLNIETMITSCPECYMTFNTTYPQMGIKINFEVVHLYDFLEQEIDRAAVTFKPLDNTITFQDSCRLSRLEEKAELPRQLLERLIPKRFEEMKEAGVAAICCGNSGWTGCDSYSKALQVKRLEQAHNTGADLLVTSCPKCQIHLKCAMEDPFRTESLAIETMDLTSIIAKTISWK